MRNSIGESRANNNVLVVEIPKLSRLVVYSSFFPLRVWESVTIQAIRKVQYGNDFFRKIS